MHSENCLICGGEIKYRVEGETQTCHFCGEQFQSNMICENDHYVCDGCHQSRSIERIKEICLTATSKNPSEIITEIMGASFLPVHGPEHHIMVGAALLAAYENAGGKLNRRKAMEEMINRGSQVPGGICGFWGCCGAAVSSGIFLSLIMDTTPMSEGNRGVVQRATAAALERISQYGGPRCCKRDSFLSIVSTVDFVWEQLGIQMEGFAEDIVCKFSERNKECIGSKCCFYTEGLR